MKTQNTEETSNSPIQNFILQRAQQTIQTTHIPQALFTPPYYFAGLPRREYPTIHEAITIFAEICGLDYDQIRFKTRRRVIVEPRQAIAHFLMENTEAFNLAHRSGIADKIGHELNLDRCTVLHCQSCVNNELVTNKRFSADYYTKIGKLKEKLKIV